MEQLLAQAAASPPDAATGLPLQSKAISISPLLSELIKASVGFTAPFAEGA